MLKRLRKEEGGSTLVEVMVALVIMSVISTIFLGALITASRTAATTIERNDDTNAYANIYASVRRDVMDANSFVTPPTKEVLELKMWDNSYVRYEITEAENGENIMTRQRAVDPPEGDYDPPAVKARGFSSGGFEVNGDQVSVTIGKDPLVVSRLRGGHDLPLGSSDAEAYMNAEELLRQDTEKAVDKEGSTGDTLILELEDGSFVRWEISSAQLERSTAASAEQQFTDKRTIMERLRGSGSFTYDPFNQRQYTLSAGDNTATFTIPVRAPR